jgi:hypothetical protein
MIRASSQLAAFHLLGEQPSPMAGETLRQRRQPALFGGFHDLTGLRYDYPLVLLSDGHPGEPVKSLADVIDEVLREVAPRGNAGEPIRRQVLRLEQEIRTLVADGRQEALDRLWDTAQSRLLNAADLRGRKELQENFTKARDALRYGGQVVGCDGQLPAALLAHAWTAARKAGEQPLRARIEHLARKLADILEVDRLHTSKAHDVRYLEDSVGISDRALFNFEVMAEVLATAPLGAPLPENRRRRIREAIAVLESQRFVATRLNSGDRPGADPPFRFSYDSCGRALAAFRKRLPEMAALIRAISIAELEIANRYDEERYDHYFSGFSEESLAPEDIALFPAYLVCLSDAGGGAARQGELLEIIGSGLPFKILAEHNESCETPPLGAGQLAFGTGGWQLANMALGLNGVFVMQAAASSLYRSRGSLLRGLAGARPALFSVYTGVNGDGTAPYLRAAAATESRAFPCFVFDPDAGNDWAGRFSLEGNPQAERDWPCHPLGFEDAELKSGRENTTFTLADFLAGDPRFAAHVVPVARNEWHADMLPVDAFLDLGAAAAAECVPYVLLIDENNRLQRAVVDQRLIDGARRCRDRWRSLQELGGVHNSHAGSLLENARQAWQREKAQLLADLDARPAGPASAAEPSAALPAAAAPPATQDPAQAAVSAGATQTAVAAAEAAAIDPDEPWIESIRCTSCNECTGINNRMFAYDADQRAYIADRDAGTYRQLVEAAESCQVCIIHPGKPRNRDEPGLDELLKRAEPFL